MGYHPRIEAPNLANFLTTRSLHSRLWFVNNPGLEQACLTNVAKYAHRYGAKFYALAIEGNHMQGPALFPKGNRAAFMRDLNSSIAKAVPKYTNHPGGRFWGRRYSNEFLPADEDLEDKFFYTVLQPVQDGLVSKISEYPGYNCFHDAVWGRKVKHKVVNWAKFNAARKRNQKVSIVDYTEIISFQYERLPGYEHLPQQEYAQLMMEKLEVRRLEIIKKRSLANLGFLGPEKLRLTVPGALPKHTKTSTIHDHRPRILCLCPIRRAEFLNWYFDIYFRYKQASLEYRTSNLNVKFPPGTYPPHLPWQELLDAA